MVISLEGKQKKEVQGQTDLTEVSSESHLRDSAGRSTAFQGKRMTKDSVQRYAVADGKSGM